MMRPQMPAELPRLIAPLTLALALVAASPLAVPADWGRAQASASSDDRAGRAHTLRAQAQQMREAADRLSTQTEARCQTKFLISSCLEEARRAHIGAMGDAAALDTQAAALELELRQEQAARNKTERERRAAEKRDQAVQGRADVDAAREKAAAADSRAAQRRADAQARAASELSERERKDAEKARGRARRVEQARARAAAAEHQRAEIDRRKAEKEAKRKRDAASPPESKPMMPPLVPGG